MTGSVTVLQADDQHTVIRKVNDVLRVAMGVEFAFVAAEAASEATFSLRPCQRVTKPATAPEGAYSSFAARLCRGTVKASMINAFIGLWHNSKGPHRPIYGYLGLTREEYYAWVETGDSSALKRSVLSRLASSQGYQTEVGAQ